MSCNCGNANAGSDESNATVCEETCPTVCQNPLPVSSCGCTSGCGCLPSSQAAVTPYYNVAEACQEAHSRVCINNRYVTGIAATNSFVVPACGQEAVLVVPGLQLIIIGSYLWNPTYGYLKVVGFDFASSTLTVENECLTALPVPGTVIPACTPFTIVDTPSIAASNPCAAAAVANGSILVCNNGAIAPLDATDVGQVPVSTNAGTNVVEFQTLDLPVRVCTTLTADLTLLIGNAGPYTMTVADSSIFQTNDLIQINSRTDRFTVTSTPDPTHVIATVDPVPPANELIVSGTEVCLADCCEQLWEHFENPCRWDLSTRMYASVASVTTPVPADGSLLVTETVSTGQVNVQNLNTLCTPRLALIDVIYKGQLLPILTAAADEYATAIIYPKFHYATGVIGAVPVPVPVSLQDYYNTMEPMNGAIEGHSFTLTYHFNALIPAGHELRAGTDLTVEYAGGDAAQINHTGLVSELRVAFISV